MLSIVVPTFNEESHLPLLLRALARQTHKDFEVVIVDARSTDGTRRVAQKFSKKLNISFIIEPRKGIGLARNVGARRAHGDVLLFLDADVVPVRDFLEKTMAEFANRGLALATCEMDPISKKRMDKVLHNAVNVWYKAMQYVVPYALGFCLFAKRSVHRKIGGFDETLVLNEDHDYVRRGTRHGKFRVLGSRPITISVRRLNKEGYFRLAYKYLIAGTYSFFGRKMTTLPFSYDFGSHGVHTKRSLRIAMFTDTYFPQLNGVTYTVALWKKELEAKGHEVYVFYPEDKRYKPQKNEIPIPSIGLKFYEGLRLALPHYPFKKVPKFDVVHTHTPFSVGLFGALLARKYNIPRIATFHTPIEEYVHYAIKRKFLQKRAAAFYFRWERKYLHSADTVTAPTKETCDYLWKKYKIRVVQVSNGLDTKFFKKVPTQTFRRKYKIQNKRMIGFIGRHSYEKHLEDLIGIADVFDGQILIAGSGPMTKDYKRLAAGKRNIRFLGSIRDEERPAFYSSLDFLVLPSTAETQGLVVLEANACGVPVIGAEAMGLRSTIKSGVNGYHYKPGDRKDLFAKIERAYASKGKLTRGCKKVAEQNAVERTLAKLENVYKLAERRPKGSRKAKLLYSSFRRSMLLLYKATLFKRLLTRS